MDHTLSNDLISPRFHAFFLRPVVLQAVGNPHAQPYHLQLSLNTGVSCHVRALHVNL